MKSLLPTSLLASLALLTLTPLAHAAVTVSNLGITDTGGGYAAYALQYLGMSFTVGSDYGSWSLDSVDIKAINGLGVSSAFTVELHADNGSGRPAVASLVTLTGVNPSTVGEYNFVPTVPFTLTAGLRYWLTAESLETTTSYGWISTNPTSGAESTALTGWSIGNDVARSTNGGSSWSVVAANPTKFAVNATGVPEPGSLGLLALGALAAMRRRR